MVLLSGTGLLRRVFGVFELFFLCHFLLTVSTFFLSYVFPTFYSATGLSSVVNRSFVERRDVMLRARPFLFLNLQRQQVYYESIRPYREGTRRRRREGGRVSLGGRSVVERNLLFLRSGGLASEGQDLGAAVRGERGVVDCS